MVGIGGWGGGDFRMFDTSFEGVIEAAMLRLKESNLEFGEFRVLTLGLL